MQEVLKQTPYAWAIEEFNIHGELVWSSIMQTRPKELSWIKDLPTKKHNIVITPLYKCEEKAEKITGVKSYRESTQRLIDANIGH